MFLQYLMVPILLLNLKIILKVSNLQLMRVIVSVDSDSE